MALTLSFHKLCYTLASVHKKRTRYKTKPNMSVAVRFSSNFVQVDDSKRLPQCSKISGSALLKQANTVGIIGGVSVLTTLIFLEKLVYMSSRDGKETIPFVVCSDPSVTRELPSLSSLHSFTGRTVITELNVDATVENLRRKRRFLEQSGARCIVMPCHISHAWFDDISDGCLLPFFHVGECVANELKDAKLKPLAVGNDVRIGVLASNAILTAGVYQEKLQNQGFEVVLPDKATTENILVPAIEALKRRDTEGAQNLLRVAIQILLMRAVNIVIVASDELQGLLPQNDPLHKKCVDPMDSLARSVIKWAKHKTKLPNKI